jgi:hypothetical protein
VSVSLARRPEAALTVTALFGGRVLGAVPYVSAFATGVGTLTVIETVAKFDCPVLFVSW